MTIYTDAELEKFATTSPREITYNLQRLVYGGDRVTVTINDGADSFLTVLLDVDESNNTLVFDWGGADSVNRRVLASERSVFVCAPAGVRNQFSVSKIWQVDYKKRPAFATHLPTRYVRLQRREFFRLHLPLTQRPQCQYDDSQGRTLSFPVCDLGIGGVAVEATEVDFDVAAGTVLHGGRIDLGSYGLVRTDVELRYTTSVQRGGKEFTRMGLAFGQLSGAVDTALQKYLTHVQAEMRARGV